MFDKEQVEQLATALYDVGRQHNMQNGGLQPWLFHELNADVCAYWRVLARFVLTHCDEFTAANLLAHTKQTCVERKVER